MDQSSVESALSTDPHIYTEDFIWAENGTEVTIPLSSPLNAGTNYTITLSTSAKATDGTPMSSPYTVKFYAMEDFSGSDSGWPPVMVSIVSIGVLLLIALLMMRGLIKRNTREQDEEDED